MALLETILQILTAGIAAGVFRNVGGYLKTALEDGIMSTYEWAMLGSKVIEGLVLATALTLGGADLATTIGGSMLLSYGRSAIENK